MAVAKMGTAGPRKVAPANEPDETRGRFEHETKQTLTSAYLDDQPVANFLSLLRHSGYRQRPCGLAGRQG